MIIYVVEDERWALAELVELFKIYETRHRVYAFDNGDDALAAARTIRPQLVITDINMPGIDGLELIEQLYALDPAIKTVILSVHDQFEYARQGMKFGVSDYLLKPVKKEVLFHAVDQAILHIEQNRKRAEEWMSGSIAQMLLTANTPEYEVLRSVNERAYCLVLLVLETGRTLKGWKETWLKMADLKKQLICTPSQEPDMYGVDLDSRQRVLLIPLADTTQLLSIKGNLTELLRQLQLFPAIVHIGYTVKPETSTLFEAYSRLSSTMEEQIFFGKPSFLTTGMPYRDADIGHLWEKVRVMETQYKKGDLVKGQAALHHILSELENKPVAKRQLRQFINDMLFSLKYNWLNTRKGSAAVNELPEEEMWLNRLTGYGELFEWLNERLVSLYCEAEMKEIQPKGLIPVLLQMIHTQYQTGISLQQFAADHHVSLGYLSRMFKHQTGVTFSDYVAGYRIRKAKELLTGGIGRLQEVSRLVGYEDVKHFSALFKKIVGEAPIAYARRSANGGRPVSGKEREGWNGIGGGLE